MTSTETFSEYLDRVYMRREVRLVIAGHADVTVDDLVGALQVADRLALAFDLAFGNRLYVTRTGAGDYRASFVPCGADTDDLQGTRRVDRAVLGFYNDLAPVRAVDVTETPLAPLYDGPRPPAHPVHVAAVGRDAS